MLASHILLSMPLTLSYPGKQSPAAIRAAISACQIEGMHTLGQSNWLIQGDNLRVLKHLIDAQNLAGQVDLVYLDPPFATQKRFSLSEGRASTISAARIGRLAYEDQLIGAAFLEFLRARLILLHELLSERGSIYLHIDYKVGHYVKVIMDEIFGEANFRNDLSRIKCNPKNFKRRGYGNVKDLILFYSKGPQPIWQEPHEPYSEEDLQRLFPKVDAAGRRYTTIPLHAPGETKNGKTREAFRGILPPPGRHWRSEIAVLEQLDAEGLIEWSSTGNPRRRIYAEEQPGKRRQDILAFKDPQYPVYPTEKNAQLLKLIIETSSLPDSLVLDCFGGSGTTLLAAERLGRRWIGIDASETAIEVARQKLAGIEYAWGWVPQEAK
jgi:adenine-specific DNA-methyltransferase